MYVKTSAKWGVNSLNYILNYSFNVYPWGRVNKKAPRANARGFEKRKIKPEKNAFAAGMALTLYPWKVILNHTIFNHWRELWRD